MFSFRVRTTKGVLKLPIVKDTDTTETLYEQVYKICKEFKVQVRKNGFDLLSGYPPKPVEASKSLILNDDELGLKNGDVLLLRQKNASLSSSSSKPSPKASESSFSYTSKLLPGRKGKKIGKATRQREPKQGIFTPNAGSGSPSPKARRQPYIRKGKVMGSKEDIAERLISATDKWHHKDPVEIFLRKAQKLAVLKQYEVAEGNRRYAAALSGEYEFDVVARKLSGAGSRFSVKYKAGPRSYHEEEFDLIEEPILKRTLHEILGTDEKELEEEERKNRANKLKPFFISEISPQMFWSFVKAIGSRDFKSGFQKLIPEVNWDFIDVRNRKLSEKAREAQENERFARSLRASKRRKKVTEDENETNEMAKSKNSSASLPTWIPKTLSKALRNSNLSLLEFCCLSRNDKGNVRQSLLDSISQSDFSGSKQEAEEQLNAWVQQAQEHCAKDLVVSELIAEEEVRCKLKELLDTETVYDVMRLKVPGRIEFISSELKDVPGVSAMLKKAQEEATKLIEKYDFLDEYRTRG